MTITREQVADLRPGDVVELTNAAWPAGSAIRGALRRTDNGDLVLKTPHEKESFVVRSGEDTAWFSETRSLTVISRAPRPLYVNHDRSEPMPGDVACDDEAHRDPAFVWCYLGKGPSDGTWFDRWGYGITRSDLADRLRLLVDGETGQVVP